jgi:hypothetical protein
VRKIFNIGEVQMENEKQEKTWEERQKELDEIIKRLKLGSREHDEEAERLHRKLSRLTPEDLLRRFTI